MEKIAFFDEESGEEQDFYILSETVINQQSYLLVTDADPDEEDGDCYIMRKVNEADGEISYEFLEDQKTIDAVFAVFKEELSEVE